jgi:peptidyl-prolyl cis-trans isomerase SurA
MTARSSVLAAALLAGASARSFAQTTPVTPPDSLSLRFADGIVAICEDKVITVDDVRHEIQPLLPQLQRDAHNEQDFNRQMETLQDNIIQQLIDRVLIIKEFRKDEKKHIPDSFVDSSVADDLTNKFDNDRSKFLSYLRSKGETMRDYRKEVEDNIIYGYETHQQHKSADIISPVRIEQFYKENKDQFYQEDSVNLRMIQLTPTEGESDSELKARADAILVRFRSGEKFEDLAKEYSQDLHRSKGGDWGEMKRTQLIPEFGDAVFRLKKSEVSTPIVYQHAVYILYVADRKYSGIQPLSEVRPNIEHILQTKMAQDSMEHWLERLRRNGYIKHF